MEKWVGKTAIVTGASSGIGAAIVRDFAKAGINVIALARRLEKLNALQEELESAPGKVTPLECDVADKESVEAAFKTIEESFGVVHILINNAGIMRPQYLLSNDDDLLAMEQFENVVQTNIVGLVHCTRKAFNLMEKSGDFGMIINIGSTLGHSIPWIDLQYNVYPGSKFAVRAITDVVRFELFKRENRKIRVAVSSTRSFPCKRIKIFNSLGNKSRRCCNRYDGFCGWSVIATRFERNYNGHVSLLEGRRRIASSGLSSNDAVFREHNGTDN